MELVTGGDLLAKFCAVGEYSETIIAGIAKQMFLALNHMHK